MATTFDTVSIIGLRATHFEQILASVEDSEAQGFYYGNKKQYYKRHKEIKKWLEGLISMARDHGNRIPKE